MMPGVSFGMDGLALEGTKWYNPKTGEKFTVVSNYFEDNNMIVQTNTGRMLRLDQMDEFVQWTGNDEPPTQAPSAPSAFEPLPPEVASIIAGDGAQDDQDGLLPEDAALISGRGPVDPLRQPLGGGMVPQAPQTTPNYDIIKRALAKTNKPEWHLAMAWDGFPEREMGMLLEVMDVPIDEISDYYMNGIRDEFESFMDDLRTQFNQYIMAKLGIDIPTNKTEESEVKPKASKSTKTPKSNGKKSK